jgi:hypothetical protein
MEQAAMNRVGSIKAHPLVLNGVALLIGVGLYLLVFKGIWNARVPSGGIGTLTLVIGVVGLILVHEGIHAAAALLFVPANKISFRVGLLVVMCRVDALMTRNQFILYSLAPAAVLGLAGILLYYVLGSVEGKFLSALLFLGGVASAGGDIWFAFQLLKLPRGTFVIDRGIEMEVFDGSPSQVTQA